MNNSNQKIGSMLFWGFCFYAHAYARGRFFDDFIKI